MIIKISAQEIKKGLPMKEDWYKATIVKLGGKAAKNGAGIDYTATLLIDDKSTEGREIEGQFNVGYPPAKTLFGAMILSADGKTIDKDNVPDVEFDTDNYVGKPLKVKIGNDLYNGSMIPKFRAFLPIHIDTDNVPF